VFATMDDIAGKFAQAERQLAAKIKYGADKDQEAAQKHESAAELAKKIHEWILPEGLMNRFRNRSFYSI
jgi:hypothetical protein